MRQLYRQRDEAIENRKTVEAYNEELKSNVEWVTHVLEDKSQRLAMISHDLRSPINRVKALVKLLKSFNEERTEQESLFFDLIERNLLEMQKLVTKMLNAKTGADETSEVINESVNIHELIKDLRDDWSSVASEKLISLSFNHSGLQDEHLFTDRILLKQILENLLSNAIKFTPLGKKVHFLVTEKGKFVEFVCSDEGLGITKEDMTKMFKMYQRLSGQPTYGESSTGLGLFIVKKLAISLNADIRCESEQGKGTSFILTVPR